MSPKQQTMADLVAPPHSSPNSVPAIQRSAVVLESERYESSLRPRGPAYRKQALQIARTGLPLLATDAIAILAALLLAATLTSLVYPVGPYPRLPKQSLTLMAMILVVYPVIGMYPGTGLNPVRELRQLTLATMLAFLLLAIANVSFGTLSGREATLFVSAFAFSLVFVPSARLLARSVLGRCRWWGQRALVVGGARQGAKIYQALKAQPGLGLRPAGLVAELSQHWGEEGLNGHTYLGPPEDLAAIARKHNAFWTIVAASDYSRAELPRIVDLCARSSPNLMLLLDVEGVPSLWSRSQECAGQPGFRVQEMLLLPLPRLVKRSMDNSLVILGGLLLLPILGLICVAIRISSRGPIFYRQTRIGRNGRRFAMHKFRTMVPNAQEVLEKHLAEDPALREEWRQSHKLKNDPRIIRGVGWFLRKFSLDELAQLWNVLRGEMSLVGPRPIVAAEEGRPYIVDYPENYELYQKVRPGITGLWQISGRNNTTYEERIRLDTYYIRNWSPWLDVYILACTIKTVLWQEGAY